MHADSSRSSRRDSYAGRAGKRTVPRGYPFLSHRFACKESCTEITPEMAESLRKELEEFFMEDFPAVDPANPVESVRRLYARTVELGRPACKVAAGSGRLHLYEMREIAGATEFHTLPIAFTYKFKEPFGTLMRRFLKLVANVYGIGDIRDTYYYEMAEECSQDEYEDEADSEEGDDSRKAIRKSFENYSSGEAGQRLDEFRRLEPVTFDELKAYRPDRNERKLLDVMLDGEKVFRDSTRFIDNTLSAIQIERAGTPDEIVLLDAILTYTYDRNDEEILDEFDNLINGDLDSGYGEDIVMTDSGLYCNAPANTRYNKLVEMKDYLSLLCMTIYSYE